MKLVATADLHGQLGFDIPTCDVFVIAGDLCPDFPETRNALRHAMSRHIVARRQAEWITETFRPWLRRQPASNTLVIWGNHDFVGEHEDGRIFDGDAHLMHLSPAIVCGLKFYGAPLVNIANMGDGMSPTWAFDVPTSALMRQAAEIPDDVDVLVTHAPPFGTMDHVRGNVSVGDEALAKRLETLSPQAHIFGHIHEGYGAKVTPSRYVINAASVDERYQARPQRFFELTLPILR